MQLVITPLQTQTIWKVMAYNCKATQIQNDEIEKNVKSVPIHPAVTSI